MRRFNSGVYNAAFFLYRWLSPVIDLRHVAYALPGYVRYVRDWVRYSRIGGAEPISIFDSAPLVLDRMPTTPFDRHYFYQNIWAFRKIRESGVGEHVDVGSKIDFVGMLTAICKVTFIDIRPLEAVMENFESRKGSILSMPADDNSIRSLSCLHVAEHIGLGRYGDDLDPHGTRKACAELVRVLAPGGSLYFSLPVGKPRLCFNAHRIHAPQQVLEYFNRLELVELSGIDDQVNFRRNIDIALLEGSDYACGLFHFTKK